MVTLKPCPFCGEDSAERYSDSGDWGDVFFIECQNCEARTASAETLEKADFIWNTRVVIS